MTSSASWLKAMRAESLAKLNLTRRSDLQVLTISESRSRVGYDLLVRVIGSDTLTTPEFGVEARGIDQSLGSKRWRSTLLRKVANDQNLSVDQKTDRTLPVCLFVFNIDTEEGLYLWLREPGVEQNGHWDVPNEASFEKLDREAIDRIVERVVQLYQDRDKCLRLANSLLDKAQTATAP